MSFPQDSLCLSGVSLSRQRHDILDFSICLLSRVLHVTLASWQGFGFEFHLRSSPCTFSESMDIGRSADYFIACYTVLTRAKKLETAVHGCSSWLSVWTLSCRCPVKLFYVVSALHHCLTCLTFCLFNPLLMTSVHSVGIASTIASTHPRHVVARRWVRKESVSETCQRLTA